MSEQPPSASEEKPEKKRKVAYLGPAGTFSEEALLGEAALADAEHIPKSSIRQILAAVSDDDKDAVPDGEKANLGFAALENSIEGTVNETLDALAFEYELFIQRETIMPVHLHLLGLPGAELSKIKKVWSFPNAHGQCVRFLHAFLPGVGRGVSLSTAEAAEMVKKLGDASTAAIGSARAAEVYKLEILQADIGYKEEGQTRFVTVAKKEEGIPPATGHDKSSIVVFQRQDRPGSLLSILQEFAARSINLTKLESRPTKQALGNYCFIIDFEGHISDELVSDCLLNIKAKHADLKFLGSYPSASADAGERREEAGKAWQEAELWLKEIRKHCPPG